MLPVEATATTLPVAPFTMVAPWQDGAEIPVLNTCDGDDVSPALSWAGVPDGTVELALVVTDDDADGFYPLGRDELRSGDRIDARGPGPAGCGAVAELVR